MIYIYWTAANREEATQIAHHLLEKRLIACASLFDVESIYRWQGKIEKGKEVKVILKTKEHHFDAILNAILQLGSYEVPEVSQIAAEKTNSSYLEWLKKETN